MTVVDTATYAYAVLLIDTTLSPARVCGAAIYSESKPTCESSVRTALLFHTSGATYDAAAALAWKSLRSPAFDYTGAVVDAQRARFVKWEG